MGEVFTSPLAGEVGPQGRVGRMGELFTSPLAGEVGPQGRVGRWTNPCP